MPGYPQIIQGGMGVAVSGWPLARAVSQTGQLGVVSGTSLDLVLARRLQLGDAGGHIRRALDHFPLKAMADRIWERYFVPGGKSADAPFKSKPILSINPSKALLELTVVGSFVEVFLAKEGHDGLVGINLLEKIQLPTLPALYGAMMANVDYVLMGAGIPRAIPAILDKFSRLEAAELRIDVAGALPDEHFATHFDPKDFIPEGVEGLKRPLFLAIISSATLGMTLARKCSGKVDGFVVEGKTAGGHNAPPRGAMTLDGLGEPIYGPRDTPDIEQIRNIGLPFWLAGSFGESDKLSEALSMGAQGIQVGTAFAFCEESGIDPELKNRVLEQSSKGELKVFTDPHASPTGFPFKVLQLEGTLAKQEVFESRPKICDLGYLREAYRKDDGTVGYRCPSEPDADFLNKGGNPDEIVGRKCICNGLMRTAGMGQVRHDGLKELPIMTAGDDAAIVAKFLKPGKKSYSAEDVVNRLLGRE